MILKISKDLFNLEAGVCLKNFFKEQFVYPDAIGRIIDGKLKIMSMVAFDD